MAVVEELPKSHHVYCLGYGQVWRVNIPYFDQPDKLAELKIEPVFTCDSNLLPTNMRLFSSGRNVYMVGGTDYHPISQFRFRPSCKLHVLDPTSFEVEFPIKDPKFLYKPIILPPTQIKPLLSPLTIQVNHKIYFLTQHVNPWFGGFVRRICFQSFDPSNNSSQVLPSPPYLPAGPYEGSDDDLDADSDEDSRRDLDHHTIFKVAAYFVVLGYVYMFIHETFPKKNEFAFSFNTQSKSSAWKERKSMLHQFREKKIPIPFLHVGGDTGVSDKFEDGTRILVTLCNANPIAYRVTRNRGALEPKSFRLLKEINSDDPGTSQIHDIGKGRFCIVHDSSNITRLKVYVFKIDFAKEHEIQTSTQVSSTMTSSEILCSRKFSYDIPPFYAYCLASAPASQSFGNQLSVAEEQDRDGKMDKRTRKRKRNM